MREREDLPGSRLISLGVGRISPMDGPNRRRTDRAHPPSSISRRILTPQKTQPASVRPVVHGAAGVTSFSLRRRRPDSPPSIRVEIVLARTDMTGCNKLLRSAERPIMLLAAASGRRAPSPPFARILRSLRASESRPHVSSRRPLVSYPSIPSTPATSGYLPPIPICSLASLKRRSHPPRRRGPSGRNAFSETTKRFSSRHSIAAAKRWFLCPGIEELGRVYRRILQSERVPHQPFPPPRVSIPYRAQVAQ